MSSPSRPWAYQEGDNVSSADSNITDQGCTSSTSNSSIPLRAVKSTSDLPIKNSKHLPKKLKYSFQKVDTRKSKCRVKPINAKSRTYSKHSQCSNQFIEITSESSTEDVPSDFYQVKTLGNVHSKEPFACSIYVTSYNILDGNLNMHVTIDPLVTNIEKIVTGKTRIQKTYCGLIIAFTKEDDAEKVIKLPLQHIFGGPIQVARFLSGEYKFRHNIIIRDIPWCISNIEIQQALKLQGIRAGKVVRTRTHVKIEVLNALDMQRLLEEGLNFFNYTSFNAIPESSSSQGEPDIVQCFKCQGFWHTSTHCRQMPRCVRCGENHDVEYCPRPRSAPVCCHCGGPHHAAYKMCPVRLQHINSTYVGFQLAKGKPTRFLQNNMY
ncbi:hypothetical protein RN001_013881 [Aquatica leii]|uniref:Gag-like protein n=1 Tax=Aquatica leii TaxID=1421715 RepID=A0AAN7P518_9COLE|nr:hypothetical protein RN001_013881 [Aquatica leii]